MVVAPPHGERRVLVTGASGFVGGHLCSPLLAAGWQVRGALRDRRRGALLPCGVEPVHVGPLGPDTGWERALEGCSSVIHLAARVHLVEDGAADPLAAFRAVNRDGTERLAREAVRCGVRRLVFVSSVKVNGEESPLPYRAETPPRPTTPYGVSKWEAEEALRSLERESGLEVVVLRPPLVYGPGVRANFLRLMGAVRRGVPLPFRGLENLRSLLYVGNLADALVRCAGDPRAAGHTYLVSDGEDLSTAELLRRTGAALGVPARLFPLPPRLLRVLGGAAGQGEQVERLLGSLCVDMSKIRNDLGWTPPFSVEQGLAETARWFLARGGGKVVEP